MVKYEDMGYLYGELEDTEEGKFVRKIHCDYPEIKKAVDEIIKLPPHIQEIIDNINNEKNKTIGITRARATLKPEDMTNV